MGFDFGGYATKNGLKCSDGRTIMPGAFKEADGQTVPLVWQHLHDDPANILGHARLENREDGVYAYCELNDTDAGRNAKILIQHGDIDSLSIYANELKHTGMNVVHGAIREVSLVIAGANPGAKIDFLSFAHGDGTFTEAEDEAVIYTGEPLGKAEDMTHSADTRTVKDVWNTLNEDQKEVVYAMIAQALETEDEGDEEDDMEHSDEGDGTMKFNAFAATGGEENNAALSHSQISAIFTDAQTNTKSLKASFLAHAQSYGIENIDILFPDAKLTTNPPDWIKRETEWVAGVVDGAKHSPFSRIKSAAADITADEARAKGYVKGNLKKEEVFKLLKRVTGPTTIYKKQKLDRDDLIDITDLNVVAWMKAEMRMMLREEMARAVLIGDGRDVSDEDKINEDCIRPIAKEDDMYAEHVELDPALSTEEKMEKILRAMDDYQGSGSPTLYVAPGFLTDMLLLKDKIGRRYYYTKADVASALGVSNIVTVPIMKGAKGIDGKDLLGVIINMKDYTIGADRGGEVSMFDDFDIDYNQYKYLLETRISGCLTHPKSALVIELKKAASGSTTPTTPTTPST